MVDVPWPTSSNPGQGPGEGAGRLVNCFAFSDANAPRWRPLPGLNNFAPLPPGEIRGGLYQAGALYAVAGSSLYQVDGLGNATELEGALPGDGPVTAARNNSTTPTITLVTSDGAFVLSSTNVIRNYPDGNLPQVNDVAFLDGYFLWTTANGNIWASGLNSTTVNPLSFASAEARLDGLLRGIVYGQQFFAFGTETIEVWNDAGTQPFPLQRSNVIQTGLIGPWAISGYQDGWAGPLIFVAQDGSVRRLDGYTPTRISGDDLEGLIAHVTDKTTLRAAVYTFGGNAIWSLSSPDWTWEFNVTTGQWHERMSYRQARWRGAFTVKAFDKWIIADNAGVSLYALDADLRTEGGDPLVWGLDSGAVKQFPQRIQVPQAYFDFVLGQATIMEDPKAMISWSHDGGSVWASPIIRSLGRQGAYRGRVGVNRVGLTSPQGVRWRFRVSDPAYSSFAGARMDAAGRR